MSVIELLDQMVREESGGMMAAADPLRRWSKTQRLHMRR
jgi:hypothetical protein